MTAPTHALGMLARKLGVLTEYEDARKKVQHASADTLIAILRSLGVDINAPDDADNQLRALSGNNGAIVPAVVVAWDGEPTTIEIRAAERFGPVEATLVLENGDTVEGFSAPVACAPGLHLLNTPAGLPLGYHTLHVRAGIMEGTATLLSAPTKTWTDPARRWIGFLPLYSLHSKRNPDMADLKDLADLGEWLKQTGGGLVGTLPLLPTFLEAPFVEPSPYAPISRLAWNELYLNVPGPASHDRPTGREVDYERTYARKRTLVALAAARAHNDPTTKDAITRFVGARPHLFHYARYRAATSLAGEPWRKSEEAMSSLYGPAFDDLLRFHEFAQWQADVQMSDLDDRSAGLYLDYPIGVHRDGFDSWRYPEVFVDGVAAGAPPDDYFHGQNWGFKPFHPAGIRNDAFHYFRETIAHHMRHASVLRFDHVMGLHRLYYIPNGFPAGEGTYVEYPADELYAVLCIESHRTKTMVIGEDLGTVPPYVPKAMKKHAIGGMFVGEFAFRSRMHKLPIPPAGSLASLDTHDTPPFARWWRGADIDDRKLHRIIYGKQATAERRARTTMIDRIRNAAGATTLEDVQQAVTDTMAASPAALVLVNLEDLWHEDEPQNIPGTNGADRSNWRRRSALSLEEIRSSEQVNKALQRIARLRKESTK